MPEISSMDNKKKIRCQVRRKYGLCAVCGEIESKTYRCLECEKIRQANRKMLERSRLKKGICPRCKGVLDNRKYKSCSKCREKDRAKYKNSKPKKKKAKSVSVNKLSFMLEEEGIDKRVIEKVLGGL